MGGLLVNLASFKEIVIEYAYPNKKIELKQQILDGTISPIIKIVINGEIMGFITLREIIKLIEEKNNKKEVG